MSTVRYTVLDGELLSENRNGTKRDYVPDPLGSTLALLDATQTQTDTFAYWPYGEVASRTGSTATPFGYGGTLGYYTEGSAGRLYVRARHYSSTSGRWISEDPIGFDGGDYNLYRYAGNNPTGVVDPSGNDPCKSKVDPKIKKQVEQDLRSYLPRAFPRLTSSQLNHLVSLMMCIAQAESNFDPKCKGSKTPSGRALGIFQIKQTTFTGATGYIRNKWNPNPTHRKCQVPVPSGTNLFDVGTNVLGLVNVLFEKCSAKKGDVDLYDILANTLPGKPPPILFEVISQGKCKKELAALGKIPCGKIIPQKDPAPKK